MSSDPGPWQDPHIPLAKPAEYWRGHEVGKGNGRIEGAIGMFALIAVLIVAAYLGHLYWPYR